MCNILHKCYNRLHLHQCVDLSTCHHRRRPTHHSICSLQFHDSIRLYVLLTFPLFQKVNTLSNTFPIQPFHDSVCWPVDLSPASFTHLPVCSLPIYMDTLLSIMGVCIYKSIHTRLIYFAPSPIWNYVVVLQFYLS